MANDIISTPTDSGKSSLSPIETIYNGYKFQSRLEARWGVFLDALKDVYDYEKEGFDLDGVWYLPDFWLPQQDCWLEIKGDDPEPQDEQKARLLSDHSGKRAIIAIGAPWRYTRYIVYSYGIRQNIVSVNHWSWFICPTCQALGIADALMFLTDKNLQSGMHNPGCGCKPEYLSFKHERLINAYRSARQARFDRK